MIITTVSRRSIYRKSKANRLRISRIWLASAFSFGWPLLLSAQGPRQDPELARELLQRGGKLIADYDSSID